MSKSIEGLTIEELEALQKALACALLRSEYLEKYCEVWCSLLVDVGQQIKDQTFEQELKNNLPI
jgi:hypothetical protein